MMLSSCAGVVRLTFLHWTSMLDWCVVGRRGSKTKHHEGMWLQEIGVRFQTLLNYSTLDRERGWEGSTYPVKESTNMHLQYHG